MKQDLIKYEGDLNLLNSTLLERNKELNDLTEENNKLKNDNLNLSQEIKRIIIYKSRTSESPLCNLVTDSLRAIGNGDITMMNAGTVRTDLEKGNKPYIISTYITTFIKFTFRLIPIIHKT